MKLIKKLQQFEYPQDDGPTTEDLTHLTKMIRDQKQLQTSLEAKYEEAYKIIAELNDLRLRKLPEYAKSIGVESLTLDSGEKFELKSEISAKIPEKNRQDAIVWLKKNGHGSLIKKKYTLEFDASKEGDAEAHRVHELLRRNDIPFSEKADVHSQTLKKFAKERIESMDHTFDRKLFGVYEVEQSIINGAKPPKFKKS